MKIIEHKIITYLSGYLFALSEINGNVGEHFARVDFFESTSNSILEDIKILLDFSDKFIILDEGHTTKYFTIEHYIANVLYTNPFSSSNLSEDIINERKKYSAFHIVDLLDIELLHEIEEDKELFMYYLLDEKSNKKYILLDIKYSNYHITFFISCKHFNGFK